MHFIYLISVICALPLSTLDAGFENHGPALRKRGSPTPGKLAEQTVAEEAAKAAASEANAKASRERQQIRELKKAEKTRKHAEAKALADENTAKQAAEKSFRKAPAEVHPHNFADTTHVVGQPDPVKLKFSNGFVDKHIKNGVGSGIGKEKTVIEGPLTAFEPGAAAPNPKGPGQRLTLTSQHSVSMRHFEKSPSGNDFVETGSSRGRVTVSGRLDETGVIIDHFEKVIPSRSPIHEPATVPSISGLARAASLARGIRV